MLKTKITYELRAPRKGNIGKNFVWFKGKLDIEHICSHYFDVVRLGHISHQLVVGDRFVFDCDNVLRTSAQRCTDNAASSPEIVD